MPPADIDDTDSLFHALALICHYARIHGGVCRAVLGFRVSGFLHNDQDGEYCLPGGDTLDVSIFQGVFVFDGLGCSER